MWKRLVLLIGLALGLAACQFGNVNVQRNPDGSTNITIAMNESEVNGLVQTALAQSGNPLLRNPSVDLQNGQAVISGTHDRRDGGGSVSGTVTMVFTAQNGQIVPQITGANIEGFDMSDSRIATFNQQMAQRFAERANRENNRARITGVAVTDNQMQITITVQGN